MKQNLLFLPQLPFENDLLYVSITPKASKDRLGAIIIDENGKKWLKVYVTAPAENNKANEKLLKFLSEILHISKTSLTIVQGHTSRKKVIKRCKKN